MKLSVATLLCFVLLGCSSAPFSGVRESLKLSPEEDAKVQKALRENEGAFKKCFVKPAGAVQMLFVIDGEGRPSDVEVRESTVQDPQVEQCMVHAISAMRFPAPQDWRGIHYAFSYGVTPAK